MQPHQRAELSSTPRTVDRPRSSRSRLGPDFNRSGCMKCLYDYIPAVKIYPAAMSVCALGVSMSRDQWLCCAALTISGLPTAATTMSARLTTERGSCVLLCTTVTVAFFYSTTTQQHNRLSPRHPQSLGATMRVMNVTIQPTFPGPSTLSPLPSKPKVPPPPPPAPDKSGPA
jgi:hypothetical protein